MWNYYSGFPDSSAGKESACNAGDPSLIPGLGRSPREGIGYRLQYSWASLVVQDGKESTCNVGDLRSLGREDPLEKAMATHSSILAWRIPMDRGTSWATVHGGGRELDTTKMTKHNTAYTGGTIRLTSLGRQNTTHSVFI